MRPGPTAAALALVAALAACGRGQPSAPPLRPATAPGPGVVASNVLRRDYAGSAACEACHPSVYEKWLASPMHRMTRVASPAAIRAPFDGRAFPFKGYTVRLETHEGDRYMRVQTPAEAETVFRVTKVIGGRYREDFVGVQVSGVGPGSSIVGDPQSEPVLPVSYLLFADAFRYKGYSVMVKERPRLGEHGAPWKETCIFCHNTAPRLASLYDDLAGSSAQSYQGSVSDRLLPPARVLGYAVTDEAGLEAALSDEIRALGGDAGGETRVRGLLSKAIDATRHRFGQGQLVEVGIGCEACHGGSKEHAANPAVRPSFTVQSPFVKAVPAPGAPPLNRAQGINRTCAGCHTVLFSKYPFTWEGGKRKDPVPGGSTTNSGEARDFLLGACSGELACTTCHDPHAEDPKARLDALGTVAGNPTCTACHGAYAGKEALAAHTHHRPDGDGSACLGCHMPRKNSGLAYELSRYHRIGKPTDRARVEHDRPLECAVCHADRSVESLAGTMETWWKKRYDRAALRALYGDDLAVNALEATVDRGKPHEQMVAAVLLGKRGDLAEAPRLSALLVSPYPLARSYAKSALEGLAHRKLPVDLDGDEATIRATADAWLAALRAPVPVP